MVHGDDHLPPALDVLLEAIGALGDFPLRVPALDRRNHAAHFVDRAKVLLGFRFQIAREPLDEVRAAERIDGAGHAGLEGQNLLRAERQCGGRGGRQRQRLVQ